MKEAFLIEPKEINETGEVFIFFTCYQFLTCLYVPILVWDRRILVWEDGFCDLDECERVGKDRFLKGRFGADIFFKLSHEVYNYGEG